MENIPNCPECQSEYTYEEGDLYICPMCAHEWSKNAEANEEEAGLVVRDANGNILEDGDRGGGRRGGGGKKKNNNMNKKNKNKKTKQEQERDQEQ